MAERNAQMSCRLMELNNHCLKLIFGHVSDVDLANLKESYDELAKVVNTEFERRGSSILFCEDNTDESLQVFRHFGRFFDRIELRYDEMGDGRNWGDIFSVINEYCSENVKSFALSGEATTFITTDEIEEFSHKLQNVEEIHLSNKNSAILSDYTDIVTHCFNVRKAVINTVLDFSKLLAFIRSNPNLLSLEIIKPEGEPLESIVDYLMETRLEEFGIHAFDETHISYDDTLRLVHLKHLGVNFYDLTKSRTLNSLLENIDEESISLTTLTLSNVVLYETSIINLSFITRLKGLKLIDCYFRIDTFFRKLLTLCGNKNFETITILYGNKRCDNCDPFQQFGPCDDCSTFIDRTTINRDRFLEIVEKRTLSANRKCLHLVLNRKIYLNSLEAIPPEVLAANESIVKLMDPNEKNGEYENNFHFMRC